MKKTFFLITTIALALSACSKEQVGEQVRKIAYKIILDEKALPSDTPLPEKPKVNIQFPTETEIANKIAENKQYIDNKITQKDGKTIHYFTRNDKDEYYLEDKTKAKFYRLVLGKTAENHCAVQDFYINGKKKTEEYIVLDTDCTKHLKPINLVRMYETNFSTFILYDKQDKVNNIKTFDRQNKIFNSFVYNETNAIINFDFNLNQKSFLHFDDKNNPSNYSFTTWKFNESQIISQEDITVDPFYDEQMKGLFPDEYKYKASRITNIDHNKNRYTHEIWAVSDSGKMFVKQWNFENTDKLKEHYQNFINVKAMIERD